jgi:hypothetical protein
MAGRQKGLAFATTPAGTWVQTERRVHEQWAKLSVSNPRAASVLHVLVSQMGLHNALVTSQANLAPRGWLLYCHPEKVARTTRAKLDPD